MTRQTFIQLGKLLVVLLLVTSNAAHAGWFSYDNYEDCMLGRMKGQSPSMFSNADKLCKKEFKVEFDIYPSNAIKWSLHGDDTITTVAILPNDEYVVISGMFTFSSKPCEEVKDADMGKPIELRFGINNVGIAPSVKGIRCARSEGFRGHYK